MQPSEQRAFIRSPIYLSPDHSLTSAHKNVAMQCSFSFRLKTFATVFISWSTVPRPRVPLPGPPDACLLHPPSNASCSRGVPRAAESRWQNRSMWQSKSKKLQIVNPELDVSAQAALVCSNVHNYIFVPKKLDGKSTSYSVGLAVVACASHSHGDGSR